MKLVVMVWLRSKAVIPELSNTSAAGNNFDAVLLVLVMRSTCTAAAQASKHLWKISKLVFHIVLRASSSRLGTNVPILHSIT